MWREYTREVPARRGLTLLAASLALGGTVALAYMLSDRSAVPDAPMRRVFTENWPVSLELPERLYPVADAYLFDRNSKGDADHVVFENETAMESVFLRYDITKPGVPAADIITARLKQPAPTRHIATGIGEGEYVTVETTAGPMIIAVVTTPEGLSVELRYSSPDRPTKSLRRVRAICASIQWEPWSIRKPAGLDSSV